MTLVQVYWEPGPTGIVPNWALHLLRPALMGGGMGGFTWDCLQL